MIPSSYFDPSDTDMEEQTAEQTEEGFELDKLFTCEEYCEKTW